MSPPKINKKNDDKLLKKQKVMNALKALQEKQLRETKAKKKERQAVSFIRFG